MGSQYPIFYQGEAVIWKETFYSDITKITPVDPTVVVFTVESPSGIISTPTVVNEPGTGNFSALKVVDEYGNWDWRWTTTNPTVVDQGTISVIEKNIY